MKETIYKCDKCGRVVAKDEKLFVVKVFKLSRVTNGLGSVGAPHPDYEEGGKELCEQCVNNLLKVDEPKGGKEDADSNGGGADQVHITDKGDHKIICGGKEIDLGKMFALKKAGWSNQMMADEFGVKRLDISNSLSRHSAKYKAFLAGKWEVKENEFGD